MNTFKVNFHESFFELNLRLSFYLFILYVNDSEQIFWSLILCLVFCPIYVSYVSVFMEHRTKPPVNAESADNPFGFILSYAANITETKDFYQVHIHSRLKCLGGVPVLWSKCPLASSLLQAIKTCRQACPPGYLMHFS